MTKKFQTGESQLKLLSDDQLEQSFQAVVRTERKIMHVVILHIQEVERRKLYLKKAVDSLYKYLTQLMG